MHVDPEELPAPMGPQTRLLVIEVTLPVLDNPVFGNLLDLNMLVMSGGRELTNDEYARLLEESGFRLTQAIPTRALVSILEAIPS